MPFEKTAGRAKGFALYTPNVGPGLAPQSYKLAIHASSECGSAALLCGKPLAFRPVPEPSSSSAQAGRLSLPACAEEVLQYRCPTERRRSCENIEKNNFSRL
jgi:hypothetical protein